MKIIRKLVLVCTLMTLSSCCIYHTTTNTPNGKVSEIGIAPYKTRPTEVQDGSQE